MCIGPTERIKKKRPWASLGQLGLQEKLNIKKKKIKLKWHRLGLFMGQLLCYFEIERNRRKKIWASLFVGPQEGKE